MFFLLCGMMSFTANLQGYGKESAHQVFQTVELLSAAAMPLVSCCVCVFVFVVFVVFGNNTFCKVRDIS